MQITSDLEQKIGTHLVTSLFSTRDVCVRFTYGELEPDVVHLLGLGHDHFQLGCFLDHLALPVPHDGGLRVGLDLELHDDQLAVPLGGDARLLHESGAVAVQLGLRLDVQVQVGVALAIVVLHVAPVGTTVGAGWILQ